MKFNGLTDKLNNLNCGAFHLWDTSIFQNSKNLRYVSYLGWVKRRVRREMCCSEKIKFNDNFLEEDLNLDEERIKSIVRLRRCKDLSILKLSFDCHYKITKGVLKSLSQQVQGLPNLRTLTLDISGCYSEEDDDDDPDHENSPILTFKYPRHLSSLHLNFQKADSMDIELVPIFASNIQRCHQLDNIALSFSRLKNHFEASEAQIWTNLAEKVSSLKTITLCKTLPGYDHEFEANQDYLDSFHNLESLENLNVKLNCCQSEFTKQVLPVLPEIFFDNVASLTNLKSLNLVFSGCFSFLNIQSIKSLSKLEHLCLDLKEIIYIENQFLRDLAGTFPFLCKLMYIELILPNSGITDKDIVLLSSSFSELSQLKNLSLIFKNTRIDLKTFKIFSKNIAHLNLTSLKIILGSQLVKPKSFLQKLAPFWESEKGLTSLFSALKGFYSLENLSLDLSGFDICINEFKYCLLGLKELKQLKGLSLGLPQFDSMNDFEGLRRFLSGLKELKKINSLLLDFQGAELSDREVILLAENIRGFSQSIEDLELRFEDAKRLGNEVLDFLGLGLQSLVSLKNLSIITGGEKVFSHKAVFDLSKRLTVLKCLESLILDIKLKFFYAKYEKIYLFMINHQNLKNLANFEVFRHEISDFRAYLNEN